MLSIQQCSVYCPYSILNRQQFVNFAWLCLYVLAALSYKLDIIKKMNLDDVTAAVPLLQFSILKLRNFAALAEKESPEVPHGSRLIYIREKLQVCSLVCLNCGILDV